jgi:hypothetical protein
MIGGNSAVGEAVVETAVLRMGVAGTAVVEMAVVVSGTAVGGMAVSETAVPWTNVVGATEGVKAVVGVGEGGAVGVSVFVGRVAAVWSSRVAEGGSWATSPI